MKAASFAKQAISYGIKYRFSTNPPDHDPHKTIKPTLDNQINNIKEKVENSTVQTINREKIKISIKVKEDNMIRNNEIEIDADQIRQYFPKSFQHLSKENQIKRITLQVLTNSYKAEENQGNINSQNWFETIFNLFKSFFKYLVFGCIVFIGSYFYISYEKLYMNPVKSIYKHLEDKEERTKIKDKIFKWRKKNKDDEQ